MLCTAPIDWSKSALMWSLYFLSNAASPKSSTSAGALNCGYFIAHSFEVGQHNDCSRSVLGHVPQGAGGLTAVGTGPSSPAIQRDARTWGEACLLGAYRPAHRLSEAQRHVRRRRAASDQAR